LIKAYALNVVECSKTAYVRIMKKRVV